MSDQDNMLNKQQGLGGQAQQTWQQGQPKAKPREPQQQEDAKPADESAGDKPPR